MWGPSDIPIGSQDNIFFSWILVGIRQLSRAEKSQEKYFGFRKSATRLSALISDEYSGQVSSKSAKTTYALNFFYVQVIRVFGFYRNPQVFFYLIYACVDANMLNSSARLVTKRSIEIRGKGHLATSPEERNGFNEDQKFCQEKQRVRSKL